MKTITQMETLSLALPTRRKDLEKSAKNNGSPMEQNVLTAFGWKPRKRWAGKLFSCQGLNTKSYPNCSC